MIILVILIALGAYFGVAWSQNLWPLAVDEVVVPTFTPGIDETADWKTYTNSDYGFQLKFTDVWEGYQVRKSGPAIGKDGEALSMASFSFRVPTTSKIYTDSFGKDGFATVFNISVYTKQQWNKTGGGLPLLAKNDQYVFSYASWQDPPEDLVSKNLNLQGIYSSFKFTKQLAWATKPVL